MVRFLIVDDDPDCRNLVRSVLAPYGRCDLAYDGYEAIGVVRINLEAREPYDLVCLDVSMPGIDGHEVLDSIRSLERQRGFEGNRRTKVILMSALEKGRQFRRVVEEGWECYVAKPLDAPELQARVRRLLGELPASKGPVPAPSAATSAAPAPARGGAAHHSRPRYLIVDDDGVCRELLRDILSRYGQCDFAYDGTEAIDAVRLAMEDGDHYDLICLDIMMPGSSGHEVLEVLRQLEEEHGVLGSDRARVIMTTALRDSKHCVRAFREGCEAYVTKPIDQKELLFRMRELGLFGSAEDRVPAAR